MIQLSIRTKFMLISTISIVLCALLVFAISLKQHQQIYLNSVESNLDALTANVADELLLYIGDQDSSFEIKNNLLTFQKYDHILFSYVYDRNWNKINQYVNINKVSHSRIKHILSTLPEIKSLPYVTSEQRDVLAILKPIGEHDNPQGYLLVVHDFNAPIIKSRNTLISIALPVVGIVLLVTLILTWFLLKKLFNPLLSLSEFTKKIKVTGNYSLRFTSESSDEVATLTDDINAMLETINNEYQINHEQNKILIEQQNKLNKLANYDQLTGLPNRRFIIEKLTEDLAEVKTSNQDLSILYFDIDSFKNINDRMGHETGDALLNIVSQKVLTCLHNHCILARLAGDEFLIVLNEGAQIDSAIQVAQKIVNEFQSPIMVNNWNITTSVSIGIAKASQADYNLDTLISYADVAMYFSKNNGRGQFTFFENVMLNKKKRKEEIISLIPQAITNKQFSLFYQPKVSTFGKIEGLEALIRWYHPRLGEILPEFFIPIAEQGGKIGEITKWVISKVCSDLALLKKICGDDIVVSFNLSSKDLISNEMHGFILSELERYKQSITSLQIEITESSYLEDFKLANQFFSSIRKMGGSIALDDFGTGYSSLSYLSLIEIDTLKIDRKFVSNAFMSSRDDAILSSILELANKLNLYCCCEGIETEEHAKYITQKGYLALQGYYFSEPVAIKDLSKSINNIRQKFRHHNVQEEYDCAVN
ncbi:EAL domain-containing protein [Vibrio salinus]|uniref:EAL domain-containing protein n=1 Tax=Vibrio salinus TaxID=2899784 RepID=UPI001E5DDEF9|nr:EAL domain-containing protein [Vibrio salinus]MCE0494794.1 EAL domain-containing protein [Vibrio salinus]